MPFFYVYVLRSEKDGKLYVGYTHDLRKRLFHHRGGRGGRTTKIRGPFQLLYYEAGLSKDKALHRERYFKTGFGRKFLKARL